MTGHFVLLCAACLAFAAPAFCQDYPRTEVFGSVGGSRWWDNEGSPVNGIHFGGSVSRRLLPQFAVEFEASGFRGTRGSSLQDSPYHASGIHFMGNGLLYLRRGEHALVFVLLGAGGARSNSDVTFGSYHDSRTANGFVANAGTGVKILAGRRLVLRPEVRLIAGTAGSAVVQPFSAELRFSLGIGYRW